MDYKIVNIVAGGSFNQPISFEALYGLGDIISYNFKKYPSLYIKLHNSTVTVYRSGKYHFIGVKSIDSLEAMYCELKQLLSPYIDTSCIDKPIIRNIVSVLDLQLKINLNDLYQYLQKEDIEYEPEIFPGLIWKTKLGVANIFGSGKITCLGAKSIQEINVFQKYILDIINKFHNI